MKTDISIDDFLALGPEAFRILAGGRELQGPYRFRSETLKNIERRIDGLCDPINHDGPVWIIEFQIERKPAALYNLLSKLGLYGELHPHRDVRGLLIVPRESDRPAQPQGLQGGCALLDLVYLEDWLRTLFQREPSNPFLAVLAPLMFTDTELTAQAPALWRTITEAKIEPHHRERLSALLEYWFMERFRTLSLTEIRNMFQRLTPLQETRAYQEIFAEGKMEGEIEGEIKGEIKGKIESLKRLLARRFGSIPDWAEERIKKADGDQLDLWLDAVLDSSSLEALFR